MNITQIEENLQPVLDSLTESVKHDQRFVMVTDFNDIIALDTKTQEKLDIDFAELPRHFDFFLPLDGIEKTQHRDENVADVRAAEKMAKLFDTIKKDNPDNSPEFIHSLNVFLSRLLFCYFAEDTAIFKENQFTNALASHSIISGGDLKYWFNDFFNVLNTPENKRSKSLPDYLTGFPYVNGGFFLHELKSPRFSRRSRQAIIDSGNMSWADINPDIFGSMFQAVIGDDQRGNLGQHYTSVPNIMKVIKPLFLDELYEIFEKYKNEPRKLQELLIRLSRIKIFDPACGSGNFLIIAYKELRILEMKIIRRLLELQKIANSFRGNSEQLELIPKSQLSFAVSYNVQLFSHISLSQFYGIEIDDFAHEVATLALWLAEHQMNKEFYKEFGRAKPLSDFNPMHFGNMPNDGGGLILSAEEKNILLTQNPEAEKYVKILLGAQEFIRDQIRYCLWIRDDEKINAEKIPFIANCIERTRNHRLKSKDSGTNKLAKRSHQFRDTNTPKKNQIIIPRVSSERREYIPSGFLSTDTVISDSAQAIYDAEFWLFGVLTSKLHMVWLKTVGGKLKSDYRYAKDIVYNTFPFPPILEKRKNEITQCVFRILEERAKHSEKTLAQLYDPDKMPDGLREAHRLNDLAVERCYRSKPFETDEERLEYLFKLYERMIAEEKEKNGKL